MSEHLTQPERIAKLEVELGDAEDRIAKLEAELEAYRDAVRVDAQMDGPKFMGCNLSQLRRAWEMTRAALSETVEA